MANEAVEGGADNIKVSLKSEVTGTEIEQRVTLRIALQDYPESTAANIPILLTYRECEPLAFMVPAIADVVIEVGSSPGPSIDFFTDQAPCSWTQTYML